MGVTARFTILRARPIEHEFYGRKNLAGGNSGHRDGEGNRSKVNFRNWDFTRLLYEASGVIERIFEIGSQEFREKTRLELF